MKKRIQQKNRNTMEINKTNSWFFEKKSKTDKPLDRLTKKRNNTYK